MKHITKIATVENATAIWEYDPSWDDNCVLGGSLDIIAAIQTLAIKVFLFLFISLVIYFSFIIRFRHLDSASRNYRTLTFNVDYPMH